MSTSISGSLHPDQSSNSLSEAVFLALLTGEETTRGSFALGMSDEETAEDCVVLEDHDLQCYSRSVLLRHRLCTTDSVVPPALEQMWMERRKLLAFLPKSRRRQASQPPPALHGGAVASTASRSEGKEA